MVRQASLTKSRSTTKERLPPQSSLHPHTRKMALLKRRAVCNGVLFVCRLRMLTRRRSRLSAHERSLAQRVHALMLQGANPQREANLFGPGGELEGVSPDLCVCSANPADMLSRMCAIIGIRSLSDPQLKEIVIRVLGHKHRRKGPRSCALLTSIHTKVKHPQDPLWEEGAHKADSERSPITVDQLSKGGEVLSASEVLSALEIAKAQHIRSCEDTYGVFATHSNPASIDISEIFTSMSEDGRTLPISTMVDLLKSHGIKGQILKRAMETVGVPLTAKELNASQFVALIEGLSPSTTNLLATSSSAEFNQESDTRQINSDDVLTSAAFSPAPSVALHQSISTEPMARKASLLHHARLVRNGLSAQHRMQQGVVPALSPQDPYEVATAAQSLQAALSQVSASLASKEFVTPPPSRKVIRHDQCQRSHNMGYTPMMRNSLWRLNDTSAFALDPRTKKSIHVRSRATTAKAVNKYAGTASQVYDHLFSSEPNVSRVTTSSHSLHPKAQSSFNNSRDPPLLSVLRGGLTAHSIHRQQFASRPHTASYASATPIPSRISMNRPSSAFSAHSVSMGGAPSLISSWRETPVFPDTDVHIGIETRHTAMAALSALKVRSRPHSALY